MYHKPGNPPKAVNTISAVIAFQRYKIGLRGQVFVERNGDWVQTKNVSAADVLKSHNEAHRKNKGVEI